MIARQITLSNRLGLHARAASKLVQTVTRHQSECWLSHGDRRVNARSIMGVLLLAAPCGSELRLEVEGPDEQVAFDELVKLIEDRFGEGE